MTKTRPRRIEVDPVHVAFASTLSPETITADLMRPDAYAPYATKRVSLVETHVSWVFLLDRDVFKVKKPENMGFLDFRTLEARRAACEAEVVLNARLASDVYRGVIPICRRADGRLGIGSDGVVVDYAVHMVRLPESRRADRLLERGVLSPAVLDAVAARVAEFHASANRGTKVRRFGAPTLIAGNVEENFAQTRGSLDRFLREDEADEVVRWQTAFLRGHAERFARRAATGHICEGHGDLRLEHIYLDPQRGVTILDCTEFNERFRCADTAADVAFLSMDLAAHGRVDLAERFLATYAREANDFDLYSVVDFYESYRAFVRGKIAAMTAANPGVDDETRVRAEADARRYFLLAVASERRSLVTPSVVAVGGVIGSGKSSIAEQIASRMSAPVIDADRTRKAMVGVHATTHVHESAWAGTYDPRFTERVYAEVMRRADVVLASGRPVILDASFRSADMRRAARDLAISHSVPFRFVECRAPRDLCRARLLAREGMKTVSDGRLEIFDAFYERFEHVRELPRAEHIALDTAAPISASVAALVARLDTWPVGLTR